MISSCVSDSVFRHHRFCSIGGFWIHLVFNIRFGLSKESAVWFFAIIAFQGIGFRNWFLFSLGIGFFVFF